MLFVLFFLLVSGDTFLRRLVEVVPTFRDKRRVVDLFQEVEDNISAYLVTITLMNAAVGIVTGFAMWACGLSDPLLRGAVAFLLNYVPIMGPVVGVGLFFLAALLTSSFISSMCCPILACDFLSRPIQTLQSFCISSTTSVHRVN
jgi:predicted PurR-regulated permease PerM